MNAARRLLDRHLGKPAVEFRMTSIALLMQEVFPHYSWEVHEEMNRPAMHRLHVFNEEGHQQVDFSKQELLTYSNVKQRYTIDHRMHDALSKLFDT